MTGPWDGTAFTYHGVGADVGDVPDDAAGFRKGLPIAAAGHVPLKGVIMAAIALPFWIIGAPLIGAIIDWMTTPKH